MLSEHLVSVLACPRCKQPLVYFPRGEGGQDEASAFLLCPASRLRYRVEADVPVLLVEEAEELAPDEVARLVGRARALGLRVP